MDDIDKIIKAWNWFAGLPLRWRFAIMGGVFGAGAAWLLGLLRGPEGRAQMAQLIAEQKAHTNAAAAHLGARVDVVQNHVGVVHAELKDHIKEYKSDQKEAAQFRTDLAGAIGTLNGTVGAFKSTLDSHSEDIRSNRK